MPKPKKELQSKDMFGLMAEALKKQATQPNIFGYEPHIKQKPFHSSQAKGRLYIGGNRSGKTTGGVVEDIYWARGNHPHRRIPDGPIRGRVVGVDFLNGISKILLPEFQRWCPPSILKNGSWEDSYHKELRTLHFNNESFIEFMSYDQDTDKFAGTSRHFTHYDEEPPQHIFNECSMRLIDTNGEWWMTMTPVEGMTWIYDNIYLPGIEGENKNIHVIEVMMDENPHLSEEGKATALAGLDADERKAREKGQFVQLGGLIFKSFSEQLHVVEQRVPPKEWEWYTSIDDGWNNPTAVLWHAVSPTGEVLTFSEHYQSEMTIEEHAKIILEREANWGRPVEIRTGDPAMKQTTAQVGVSKQHTYAENGIYLALDDIPRDVGVGIERMQKYLKINPATGRPWWTITDNCTNLIREMKRLRWATYQSKKVANNHNPQEKIHKKDDHAPDSARYFFTLMPDLTPQQVTTVPRDSHLAGGTMAKLERYDEVLAKMTQNRETQWQIAEGSDTYALEYDY